MRLPFGILRILVLTTVSACATSSYAQDAELAQQDFAQCVTRLSAQAIEQGIPQAVVTKGLATARPIDKVLEYDRNQPEFVQSFASYLNKRVTDWRINKGREMLVKHRDLLNQLTQTYGVPAHYLVAFWGLETNFGAYKGKMPIIDSLATLACDPRRSEFFTKELITALRLMDREQLDKVDMVGSWAGAMGHTQFMPSAYLNYALDGDGDDKVDLWNSEADALTSAANFLNNLGWKAGLRWGREILLPEGFDYSMTGRENARPLSFWHQQQVQTVLGTVVPSLSFAGAILVPSGHEGPAFLVYDNFSVIMRWNNSESYALAVGYLADRLVGATPLTVSAPETGQYAISRMKQLQDALNRLGFDVGEADGIYGPATRKGIRDFQSKSGQIADGFPDEAVFEALSLALNP